MTDVTFRPSRAPRTSWCWFCHRAVRHDDDEARRIDTADGEQWLCGVCWLKADIGPSVPVDYTEVEDNDAD